MNKQKQQDSYVVVDGQCAGPVVCPLSRVKAGSVVCIKELVASPELQERLREMGLGERQTVKLLSRHSNIVCLVCNARLGLSKRLAEAIMVETLPVASAA